MIEELLKKLDFRNEQSIQKKAIDKLLEIKDELSEEDISRLISIGGKYTWINIIYFFKKIGYPLYKKAIPSLIELLKDMTWPGSFDAQELLKTINFNNYKLDIVNALNIGIIEQDCIWVYNILKFIYDLGYIKDMDKILIKRAIDIARFEDEKFSYKLSKLLE